MKNLATDNRGAIMMSGLFMSCFLIGSLWFVIGIGDTVVFRDRMQEAADHGAFASAALHAKGMNFISLCNLVLLTAVTIHIILGIIHDVLLGICVVSAVFTFGLGCEPWLDFRPFYTGYFNILKPAAKAIHVAELVSQHGYPAVGLIEGIKIGHTYGGTRGTQDVTVIPVSESLLPGLPVKAKPMNFLCEKIVSVGFDLIFNKALGIKGGSAPGKAINFAKGLIQGAIKFRYCNDLGSAGGGGGEQGALDALNEGNDKVDEQNKKTAEQEAADAKKDGGKVDTTKPKTKPLEKAPVKSGGGGGGGIDPGFDTFWGEDGPMVVKDGSQNGGTSFQTYAINLAPTMADDSESKVGIGRGPKVGLQKYTKTEKPFGYIAQAEFYFDCQDSWTADGCNLDENAVFQIKWRARLRRLTFGKGADRALTVGLTVLANLDKIDAVKELAKNITGHAGELLGGGGITSAGDVTRAFEGFRQDAVDAKKAATVAPGGIFH